MSLIKKILTTKSNKINIFSKLFAIILLEKLYILNHIKLFFFSSINSEMPFYNFEK